MDFLKRTIRQLRQYPSAVAGLIIIGLLLVASVIIPIVIPYDEAIHLWRGGEDIWAESPRNAWPIWYNWFTKEDLPATIRLSSADGDGDPVEEQLSADTREIRYNFEFEFPYDEFPPEVNLFTRSDFQREAAVCGDDVADAGRP